MRGHPSSSDSADRFEAICKVSRELGIEVDEDLVVGDHQSRLHGTTRISVREGITDPQETIHGTLRRQNAISALGAMRAFQEAGLRVPEDISVVGVDDIQGAAFHTPRLTTVRQPLEKMGYISAETLIERIENSKEFPNNIAIEPELVVRDSTSPVNGS